MLNAHLDTVGIMGMEDPFYSGRIEEGMLYGRGSLDMKSEPRGLISSAEPLAGRSAAT